MGRKRAPVASEERLGRDLEDRSGPDRVRHIVAVVASSKDGEIPDAVTDADLGFAHRQLLRAQYQRLTERVAMGRGSLSGEESAALWKTFTMSQSPGPVDRRSSIEVLEEAWALQMVTTIRAALLKSQRRIQFEVAQGTPRQRIERKIAEETQIDPRIVAWIMASGLLRKKLTREDVRKALPSLRPG